MNHPVLTTIAAVRAALDEVGTVNPTYMSVAEKKTALIGLAQARARVEALQMRVLAAADDVAVETGARSTAHWLAEATRDRIGSLRQASALAVALGERWSDVQTALSDGAVNVAQARVITEALDALPADLDSELVSKAQAHLVTEAGHFGPRELRRLGDGLVEVVAPQIADQAEYRRLVAEEKRARAATRLSFHRRGDGSTDLHLRVPDPVANRLRTYVDAHTSPRRDPLGDLDQLPMPRRRGEAFCALLENLPVHGPAQARRDRHLDHGDDRPRRVEERHRVGRDLHRRPAHRRARRRLGEHEPKSPSPRVVTHGRGAGQRSPPKPRAAAPTTAPTTPPGRPTTDPTAPPASTGGREGRSNQSGGAGGLPSDGHSGR